MNKKRSLLAWLSISIVAVALSSCSSMLFTTIDILRPAKVIFPPEVSSVAIINNSVVQDPDYGHTSQMLNQKLVRVSLNTDSLSVFCVAALAEGFVQKEFFSKVTLEPSTINKNAFTSTPAPPERLIINTVATRNRADGIISLNRILVNDKQGEFYNQEYNTYISYIEAYYDTQWSVHFPLKNQIYTFSAKDTVYWESEAYSRQKALNGLPDRTNALIDGALIAGEKSVNRFIPWWDKVDRYLFDSRNKSIKTGIGFFYRKDWQGASQAWKAAVTTTNNNTLKGKLTHNLAVATEIQGDVKKAKEYSDLAIEYFMTSMMIQYDQFMTIVNYNEELEQRLREVDKVDLQLGEKK